MQLATLEWTSEVTINQEDNCFGLALKCTGGNFTITGNRDFKGQSSVPITQTPNDPPLQYIVTRGNVPLYGITLTPGAGCTIQAQVLFV